MTELKRVLVDTSAWIDALRHDGDRAIGQAVRDLTADGLAVLCDVVRLELWNRASGEAEVKLLRELVRVLECVATADQVWARAVVLARASRAKGLTIPATDLLVAAGAKANGLDLLHHDAHFDQIQRADRTAKRR